MARQALSPIDAWRLRGALKTAVRGFFGARGGLEIDTPIAVLMPGTEVYLGYFKSAWRDAKGEEHRLFLRSSPELHMKQAVALGAERIFQLAPCFRNGGELADWHHPEFTLLEWYETRVDATSFIDQTEALLRETLACMEPHVRALGREPLELPRVIPRLTVAEAFERFAGLALEDQDPELGAKAARAGSLSSQATDDFETAFFKVLLDKVEPQLAKLGAAVLTDYPPSQAALATVRDGVAKRFEFYVGGIELSNGFEELLDEAANRARIREALTRRGAMGADVPAEDEDFYAALRQGLPPCCGNALGFDRWLALLCREPGIARLVPFREARPYGR